MIVIKALNKNFGKLQVINNINLEFNKGQCVALIGPNGCGKTTLIKTILGMVIPSQGDIIINGKSVLNQHEYRSAIGYMPQIGRYPGNLTIGQLIDMVKNIRIGFHNYDEELVYAFGLQKIYDKKLNTLSGGTTQKVSAVLAFLFHPQILILDEPTAGLDPLASEILKDKIKEEMQNEKLVIITSHILSELDDLVTHLLFMQEGNILFHKRVSELLLETNEDKISKAIVAILKEKEVWAKS